MKNEDIKNLMEKINDLINRTKNMKRYQYARWEKLDELKNEIEIFQRRKLPQEMHFDLDYPSSDIDFDDEDVYFDAEDLLDYFKEDVDYFISNLLKQKKELEDYGLPIKKEKDKHVKERKLTESKIIPIEKEKIVEKSESIRYFFASIPATKNEREFYIKGVIMGLLYLSLPFLAILISLIIGLAKK